MAKKTSVAVVSPNNGIEMFNLDGKGLLSFVRDAVANYQEAYKRIAIAAVLTVRHAAKHGDPDPLNLLYSGLTPNDGAALRNYVRRISLVIGLGLKDGNIPEGTDVEVLKAAADKGKFLTFSGTKLAFSVVKNDKDAHIAENKANVVKLAETQLMTPNDDNGWSRFNERDNLESSRELGDADILKKFISQINSVLTPAENSRTTVMLSDKVRKALTDMRDRLEPLKSANATKDDAIQTEKRQSAANKAVKSRRATIGDAMQPSA